MLLEQVQLFNILLFIRSNIQIIGWTMPKKKLGHGVPYHQKVHGFKLVFFIQDIGLILLFREEKIIHKGLLLLELDIL